MTESPLRIGSDLVGTPFDLPAREIGWRETTGYAAAVGDLNPLYFDDSSGKTLIAPPMITVAISWPVHCGHTRAEAGSMLPEDVAVTGVHAGAHLIFNRPIRAGEPIAVAGRLISMQPTRAGTLSVTRLDLVDTKGETVAVEYNATMYRGVECTDGGRSVETVPATPGYATPDQPLRETPIPIGRHLPYIYDACTDIVNPIHTSPAFARERAGLPDIILQGTCTLALAARETVNVEAGGDPTRLKLLACRFSDFIFPGTTIRLQILGTESVGNEIGVHFRLLNADGRTAVTGGYARIAG